MKKIIKLVFASAVLLFFGLFNGCDELQSLPLNVPIPFEFEVQGNSSSNSDSKLVCIDSIEELDEHQEKIKEIKYINAAYWTESATPGLRGDLNFTLQQNGATIFTYNLTNIVVADYVSTPLEISLTDADIQMLQTYLNSFVKDGDCFFGKLELTNITSNQGTEHDLKGRVELVIEADVEF